MTLFERVQAAGIQYDSHYSDLFIPDSPEAREILQDFPLQNANATRFSNQKPPNVGECWVDIPFAFDPHWGGRGLPG